MKAQNVAEILLYLGQFFKALFIIHNYFVQFHGFLLPIVKELNGFVSRRQQALRVESIHKKYLKESVATVSYDLIQLVTKVMLLGKGC